MKIQEQALKSGLVLDDCDDHKEPQWQSSNWPRLLGGWRWGHSSVVVKHPDRNDEEIVVVIGGAKAQSELSNSVLLLNLNETAKKWREGPCLNEKRDSSASVVCNGTVFILGGYNDDDDLDTVETIEVGDLLLAPGAASTTNGWKTLDCRLSAKRSDCSAAAVHDRFIAVVGGGNTKDISSLSSVDIIDTTSKSQYAVVSGPPLNKGRYFFGMAVIGQRIYVVGGQPANNKLPVEYLEFEDCSNHADVTVTSVFPSTKSWKIQEDLALDADRHQHCVVKVGSCLVVAGGCSRDKEGLSSVEVMDTEQHVMWKLPSTTTKRNSFSMVAISNGILAISGEEEDSCEYLALTEKKTETKVCIAACCLCFWGTSHFSCLTVGCCLLQKSCSSHLVLEKLDIGIERESNNVDKEHVLKEAPQAKEPHQMKQSLLMNVTQPIVRKRSIEPELEVKMSNNKSCEPLLCLRAHVSLRPMVVSTRRRTKLYHF